MAEAGYKQLISYKLAQIAFDLGWDFVPKYYQKYEDGRQRDQIKQALRSHKQNIVEGSSERSLSTKLKLYDVAKSSGAEAKEDFEDILRRENFPCWDKDDPRLKKLRQVFEGYPVPNPSTLPFPSFSSVLKELGGLEGKEGLEAVTNYLIDLLTRCGYLLDKQINAVEQKHRTEGGYSENLLRKRLAFKKSLLSFFFFFSLSSLFLSSSPAFAGELSNQFTVSLWVNPNTSIASKALAVKDSEIRLVTDGSGNPLCQIYASGAWQTAVTSSTALSLNTWAHVACTYDKANIYVYVNGVQTGSGSQTNTVNDASTNLLVGQDDSATYGNFIGTTDQLLVYSYARTAKQITEDMGGGSPSTRSGPSSGPVAHYRFDEGFGTTANNSGSQGPTLQGSLSGMAVPATSTSGWTNSGKFGKALIFDGSDDVATVTNTNPIDFDTSLSNFTFSTWVNATSAGEGNAGQIFQKGANTYLRVDNPSGSNLDVEANLDLATTDANVNVSAPITTTTWHHIAVTWDGTTLTVYIDGVSRGTGTGSGAISADTNNLLIGGTTTANFAGTIDEVKVYNFALTADQVKLDMNRGSAQVLGALGSNSSYPSNSSNQEYCIPGDSTSCAAPVGRWDFEEGTGTSANDTSGNANTGTWNGTLGSQWTRGKIGTAGNFNGTDNSVNTSMTSIGSSGMTVEAWIKPSDVTKDWVGFVDKQNTANQKDFWFGQHSTAGYIRFSIYLDASTETALDTTSAVIANGSWYHVVATYDNHYQRIYVNGTQVAVSSDLNSTLTATHTSIVRIGRSTTGNPWFPGLIDNVRIFGYARTPAQIAWDYNRGGPVGYWKFDECQGSVAYDSAATSDVAGNNGTITIGASGTQDGIGTCTDGDTTNARYNGASGKRNSSLNFDGTDDYVTISDPGTNSIFDITSAITLSAWVKPGTSSPADFMAAVNKHNAYNLMLRQTTNAVQFEYYTGSAWEYIYGSIQLVSGTWYHLAGVWDGSNVYIYVNGVIDNNTNTNPATASIATNNNTLDIGRQSNGDRYFNGQIDDVRIYNYGMTATQVKTLFNDGAVRFGPVTGSP